MRLAFQKQIKEQTSFLDVQESSGHLDQDQACLLSKKYIFISGQRFSPPSAS